MSPLLCACLSVSIQEKAEFYVAARMTHRKVYGSRIGKQINIYYF